MTSIQPPIQGCMIAHGSSGQIYLTEDESIVRKVFDDKTYAMHEIAIMLSLDHPNVMRMLDWDATCTQDGKVVVSFCMPRIRYTLAEFMKKPRSLSVTVDHARQILRGLAFIHDERKIMHRDLKPDNILVEPGDSRWSPARILIADFGNATWIYPGRAYDAPVGLPCYAAPETMLESFRCSESCAIYDGKVDVFAFGCIFWEMLTRGRRGPMLGYIEGNNASVHQRFFERSSNLEQNLGLFAPNEHIKQVLIGTLQPDPKRRIVAQTALLHIENA